MKIKLSSKLFVLEQIYGIYGDFTDTLDLACEKCCSQCCTNNVITTTLEGYFIIDSVLNNELSELLKRVKRGASTKRFLPQTTTNKIAELCIEGKDLPAEDHVQAGEMCPLLAENKCTIYSVRPFACRCLVSKHDCRTEGYAAVDPFVLTVNNVFLQFLEHIDSRGLSGNLTDILLLMASEKNRNLFRMGQLSIAHTAMIPNTPLKTLMIPPEHRNRVKSLLSALQNIRVPEHLPEER